MSQNDFEAYESVEMMVLNYMTGKNAFIQLLNPQNIILNLCISIDRKGVSNMYRGIHSRSKHILVLFNICKR